MVFLQPRLVLLCCVILAKRCIFVIENPISSLIYKHYRFEHLVNKISFVLHLAINQGHGTLISHIHIYFHQPRFTGPLFGWAS